MNVSRNEITNGEQLAFTADAVEVVTNAKAQYVIGKLADALDAVGEIEFAKRARKFVEHAAKAAKPKRYDTANGSWAQDNG